MHTTMRQSISACPPLREGSLWTGDTEVLVVAGVRRGRLASGSQRERHQVSGGWLGPTRLESILSLLC